MCCWLNLHCYLLVDVVVSVVVVVVVVHYSFVQFFRNQGYTWSGSQSSAMECYPNLAEVSSQLASCWAPDSS